MNAYLNIMNPFDSVEHMEPKCPGCSKKIEFDVTTEYDESAQAVICRNCGQQL